MRFDLYLKMAIAAGLLAAGPSLAGPYEDGVAALQRSDYATAAAILRPLAMSGDAKAQNTFGNMYARGSGLPKDDQQALSWYRKAAEQGEIGRASCRERVL